MDSREGGAAGETGVARERDSARRGFRVGCIARRRTPIEGTMERMRARRTSTRGAEEPSTRRDADAGSAADSEAREGARRGTRGAGFIHPGRATMPNARGARGKDFSKQKSNNKRRNPPPPSPPTARGTFRLEYSDGQNPRFHFHETDTPCPFVPARGLATGRATSPGRSRPRVPATPRHARSRRTPPPAPDAVGHRITPTMRVAAMRAPDARVSSTGGSDAVRARGALRGAAPASASRRRDVRRRHRVVVARSPRRARGVARAPPGARDRGRRRSRARARRPRARRRAPIRRRPRRAARAPDAPRGSRRPDDALDESVVVRGGGRRRREPREGFLAPTVERRDFLLLPNPPPTGAASTSSAPPPSPRPDPPRPPQGEALRPPRARVGVQVPPERLLQPVVRGALRHLRRLRRGDGRASDGGAPRGRATRRRARRALLALRQRSREQERQERALRGGHEQDPVRTQPGGQIRRAERRARGHRRRGA